MVAVSDSIKPTTLVGEECPSVVGGGTGVKKAEFHGTGDVEMTEGAASVLYDIVRALIEARHDERH